MADRRRDSTTEDSNNAQTSQLEALLNALLKNSILRPSQPYLNSTILPDTTLENTQLPRSPHVEILTFAFPPSLDPSTTQSQFKQAFNLLLTDIVEASKAGGRDTPSMYGHPVLSFFSNDSGGGDGDGGRVSGRGLQCRAYVPWCSDASERGFKGSGAGRGSLRVLMMEVFGPGVVGEGKLTEEGEMGFWSPLEVWVESVRIDRGCFEEVEGVGGSGE